MATTKQPLKKRKLYDTSSTYVSPPPPTQYPLSHEEILRRKRNKEEIRSLNESYRRIGFCISQKDARLMPDFEQAYLSLITASGVARVKALKSHSKRSKKHMSMRQHQNCRSFDLPKEFHRYVIDEEHFKRYALNKLSGYILDYAVVRKDRYTGTSENKGARKFFRKWLLHMVARLSKGFSVISLNSL